MSDPAVAPAWLWHGPCSPGSGSGAGSGAEDACGCEPSLSTWVHSAPSAVAPQVRLAPPCEFVGRIRASDGTGGPRKGLGKFGRRDRFVDSRLFLARTQQARMRLGVGAACEVGGVGRRKGGVTARAIDSLAPLMRAVTPQLRRAQPGEVRLPHHTGQVHDSPQIGRVHHARCRARRRISSAKRIAAATAR